MLHHLPLLPVCPLLQQGLCGGVQAGAGAQGREHHGCEHAQQGMPGLAHRFQRASFHEPNTARQVSKRSRSSHTDSCQAGPRS
ncbi:MAG: hypothetical protein ACKOFK_01140, partial [Betaproteobacteria bacterium]